MSENKHKNTKAVADLLSQLADIQANEALMAGAIFAAIGKQKLDNII